MSREAEEPTRRAEILVARLSASGNAMKQDGDIESAPVRVVLPAKDTVTLRIGAP